MLAGAGRGEHGVFKQSHLLPLCRWTECLTECLEKTGGARARAAFVSAARPLFLGTPAPALVISLKQFRLLKMLT